MLLSLIRSPMSWGKQFLVQIFMEPADPQAGDLCWKVIYS